MRTALGSFFNWLVRTRQWHENPVKANEPVRHVPTRRRRALSREELDRLIAVVPEHRAACYLLAATSGLRRSELAALTWGDLGLDAAPPTVTVRAATAKNRREETIPLPAGTVAALRALRGEAQADARVFACGVPVMRTYYGDLARAGIERETADGVGDFHALRATSATLLACSGRASTPRDVPAGTRASASGTCGTPLELAERPRGASRASAPSVRPRIGGF